MQKYVFLWDGHLGKITIAELRTVYIFLGAAPVHIAPYSAVRNEPEHEQKEVAQIERSGVAQSAVV